MEVRPGANPADVKNYDTDRLRHDFLIQNSLLMRLRQSIARLTES